MILGRQFLVAAAGFCGIGKDKTMKPIIAAKLIGLGVLITLTGYWLRGHDLLTALALWSALLLIIVKFVFH